MGGSTGAGRREDHEVVTSPGACRAIPEPTLQIYRKRRSVGVAGITFRDSTRPRCPPMSVSLFPVTSDPI